MRVLFYVEPVMFRRNPMLLYPHIDWCTWIMGNNQESAIEFHVASSAHLLGHIHYVAPSLAANGRYGSTRLRPYEFLADFGVDRAAYCRFLYSDCTEAELASKAIGRQMLAMRDEVKPDLVVATAQNSVVEAAFRDRPMLFIEQAPLPRRQRTSLRMALDPCGHQRNSIIARHTAQILDFVPDEAIAEEALAIWDDEARAVRDADPATPELRGWLDTQVGGAKFAILALQPPDWLSFEGAGASQALEDLIADWLSRLPEGWVGVPTYHVDHKLPVTVQTALAQEFGNVRFLPEHLASGRTELLADTADGMITVSSTSAAFSIISGKPTVVTGVSPFSWASSGRVEDIAVTPTLGRRQRASLLAFISHRFSRQESDILAGRNVFAGFAEQIGQGLDPVAWCLDPSGWTPGKLRRTLAVNHR